MTSTKDQITFRKIDADEHRVILNDVEVGWLERERDYKDVGTITTSWRPCATTWHFNSYDDRIAQSIDDLGKLYEAKRAVRSIIAGRERDCPKCDADLMLVAVVNAKGEHVANGRDCMDCDYSER